MPSNSIAGGSSARITLTHVSDVHPGSDDRAYFVARFKLGLFGKPVTRTFWGRATTNDFRWDRVAPGDLQPLVGSDVSSEVSIAAVEIEPEQFTAEATGEVITVTSRAVVVLADETLDQATRRSGSVMRRAEVIPAVHALAMHGDGYAGYGGPPEPVTPQVGGLV